MSVEILDFGMDANLNAMIKVFGVGGGGGNAVNYMFDKGIADVGFVLCNTDAQALKNSPVPTTLQLGNTLTQGLGAGNNPALGEKAAIESIDDIKKILSCNTSMVFITACMGGGTGTGAAPIIAKAARELGILTIAVVTIPSAFEGRRRYDQAIEGAKKMNEYVDSLLVINNEKIREVYGNLPARESFSKADQILYTAVKGVAEIITLHGMINIDFADVNTVMSGSKVFIMGTGLAEGEGRALAATKAALDSPLLDSSDIYGTSDILLNITSCDDEVTIGEVGEIIEYLQIQAGTGANIIWGNGYDSRIGNQVCVTIIATGFSTNPSKVLQEKPQAEIVELTDDPQVLISENCSTSVPNKEESKPENPNINREETCTERPSPSRNVGSIPQAKIVTHKAKKTDPEVKKGESKPHDSAKIDNWFLRNFNNLFEE